MNVGYFVSNQVQGQDLIWSLIKNGHQVLWYETPLVATERGDAFEKTVTEVKKYLTDNKCDCALSWNFFPALAVACKLKSIPYLAWIFDSPLLHIYSKWALLDTNYVFSLDKAETENFKSLGINAFHLPMGVNIERLNTLEITDEKIANFTRDVTMVGSLYQDNVYKHVNFPAEIAERYDRLFSKQLGDWTKNYLYDEFCDEDTLNFNTYAIKHITGIEDYPLISPKYLYCGLMLARRMAEVERKYVLNTLAEDFNVTLYNSNDDHSVLKNVECRPAVAYESEAPIVYLSSKINLNFTIKSIETGIPLRVFDATGAGGFVLSNYQEEIPECYEIGKEIETFRSMEELQDKVRFYLTHERERVQIAMGGYKRACAEHTMELRVKKMFETLK